MNDTVLTILGIVVCFAWFLYASVITFITIPKMKREIKKLKENQLSIISYFDTELLRIKDSQK